MSSIAILVKHPQLNGVLLDNLPFLDQLSLRLVSNEVREAADEFGEELCKEWVIEMRSEPSKDRMDVSIDCHRKMAVESQNMDFNSRSARSARFVHYAALGCAPSWLHVFVVELLQQRRAGNEALLSPRLKSIWSHLVVLIPEDYVGNYSWKCLHRSSAIEMRVLPLLLHIVVDHLELENGVEEVHLPGIYGRLLMSDSGSLKQAQQVFTENPKKWSSLRLMSGALDYNDLQSVEEHLPWLECIVYTPLVPVHCGTKYIYNTQYRDFPTNQSLIVPIGRAASHLYLHDGDVTRDVGLTRDGLAKLLSCERLRISERIDNSRPKLLPLFKMLLEHGQIVHNLKSLELGFVALNVAVVNDVLVHFAPTLVSLEVSSVALECFTDEFLSALLGVPWKSLKRLSLCSIDGSEVQRLHQLPTVPCSLTGLVELVTDLPISSVLDANWNTLEVVELVRDAASSIMFEGLNSTDKQRWLNKLKKLHLLQSTDWFRPRASSNPAIDRRVDSPKVKDILLKILSGNDNGLEEITYFYSREVPKPEEVMHAIASLPSRNKISCVDLWGDREIELSDEAAFAIARAWRDMICRCYNVERIGSDSALQKLNTCTKVYRGQVYHSLPFGAQRLPNGRALNVCSPNAALNKEQFTDAEWDLLRSWYYFHYFQRAHK